MSTPDQSPLLPPAVLDETFHLTPGDFKRHFHFPFRWPETGGSLRAELSFSPWLAGDLRSLITLSLTGPQGFRGAGHRHGDQHQVLLSASQATPGYLAGEVGEGEWTATVHTHLVLADTSVQLRVWREAEVEQFGDGQPEVATHFVRPLPEPVADGAWMMGDLHCHTHHSDARWTPAELAAAAAGRGLSFLALTDHNTTSGRAELAREFPGLTLPGLELTTYYGHAVLVNVPGYQDWTALTPDSGMAELSRALSRRDGAYLTIAHPFAPGDPICTGCAWTTFDLRPENTTHLEVWNGSWGGRHNETALAYWYRLIAQGGRVVATAGTDAHSGYAPESGFTCTPATSDPHTLARQLQKGQTYLAREACLRPWVEVQGQKVALGSEAPAGLWQAGLAWTTDFPAGMQLVWIVDGQRVSQPITDRGEAVWTGECTRWLNFEIRLPDGTLFALGNPVYTAS